MKWACFALPEAFGIELYTHNSPAAITGSSLGTRAFHRLMLHMPCHAPLDPALLHCLSLPAKVLVVCATVMITLQGRTVAVTADGVAGAALHRDAARCCGLLCTQKLQHQVH